MTDGDTWSARFGTAPYLITAALAALAALGIVLIAAEQFGWLEVAFPLFIGLMALLVGPLVPLARDNRLGPAVLGVMAAALVVVGVIQRL